MKQKVLSERDALILGRETERKLRLNLQLERLREEMKDSTDTSNEILVRNGLGEGRYDIEFHGGKRALGSVWTPEGEPVIEASERSE
jgi:hypothetical protein